MGWMGGLWGELWVGEYGRSSEATVWVVVCFYLYIIFCYIPTSAAEGVVDSRPFSLWASRNTLRSFLSFLCFIIAAHLGLKSSSS